MTVDKHMRVKLVKQTDQRPGFRRFQLDEVAIEVEVHGVFPHAHSGVGPDLAGSVIGSNPVVGIRVVVGCHQDHRVLQPRMTGITGQFPQQGQQGLLSRALAAVNISQQQNSQPFVFGFTRLKWRVGNHGGHHGPTLDGGAETDRRDVVGRGTLVHEFLHLATQAGRLIIAGFGDRFQIVKVGRCRLRLGLRKTGRQ